jgi:hypothetical protein
MWLRSSAVFLASLALPFGSAGFAADFDYSYAPRLRGPVVVERPVYPPDIDDEAPRPRIYTRPVVGFYAYPYDYLEHAPRSAYRPGPQPYMYARPPGPVEPYEYRHRYPAPGFD